MYYLSKEKFSSSSFFALIVVIVFSLLFIEFTFGFEFVLGHAGYWNTEKGDLDFIQHNTGINMYLSAPWKLPLLAFDGLNYPEGARVTFVDGIPIFAMALKIFLPKNLGFINFLGFWIGLCFILQAIAAWWISKELNVQSWFFLIFLMLTLLTYPALMMRLKHVALMSHWIILFSFALYLHDRKIKRLFISAWVILLFCAFYIHIYLFVMALGIYTASVISMMTYNRTWHYIFFALLPLIIIGASLFLFVFPLPLDNVALEEGFGDNNMSILAPVWGGKFIHWQTHVTRGEHEEGFNYLGLGVIIGFIWVIFSWTEKFYQLISRHWPLCGVMILLILYALSDHIYFENKLIAIIHYPRFFDFITGELRCSGRFFWPVGYAIITVTVFLLHQQLKKNVFVASISFLLLVQLSDLSGLYKGLKLSSHRLPVHVINTIMLDSLLDKNIKYLYFYPKFKCGKSKWRSDILLPITKYAAIHHLKINTGYIARYQPDCTNVVEEIETSEKKASAYVFLKSDYSDTAQVSKMMGSMKNIICVETNLMIVCRFVKFL